MRAFRLHIPTALEEATNLLATHGPLSRPLGGGSDLVAGIMRDQVIGRAMPYPTDLVDVTRIPELAGIRLTRDGEVTIGAATTLAAIAESPVVQASWPILAASAGEVASPEIRTVGTLGGNLHQRPRCWFFRNRDFDCIKKGGDICFAVKGDNRYNAILEGHLCFIVHPSDLAVTLLALGARARAVSSGGERTIALDDYFVGPGENLVQETVLAPDELLVDVTVPVPASGTVQAWEKVNEKGRQTWDFALASVAIAATIDDGMWRDGRIVLGSVAPVPYRALIVEAELAGRDVREALPDAIAAVRRASRPMSGNAFKLELLAVVLERVVLGTLDASAMTMSRDPAR